MFCSKAINPGRRRKKQNKNKIHVQGIPAWAYECCENIPLFLCEFDHHGWELIQHKYTRQTLISNQPIGYFFMSGHWKLVCLHHLRKTKTFQTYNQSCLVNSTDLQFSNWLETPPTSKRFLFYSKTSSSGSSTFIKTFVFQYFRMI